MSDEQSAGAPDLSANLKIAEERVQELVSVTSIDLLGTSTRAYLDKAMLVSSIGILISTFGNPSNELSLGGIKITLPGGWVIPAVAAFAIVFYAGGLVLLARMDFRRWTAIFNLKSASLLSLLLSMRQSIAKDLDDSRAFDEDWKRRVHELEVDEANASLDEVEERMQKRNVEQAAIGAIADQINARIGLPAGQLRRQARTMIALFVALPLTLSIVALVLCVWTAWQTYLMVS